MANTQAPTNYQWIGNELTYTLPSNAEGLKLKYKKQGTTTWLPVYESLFNAPSSIILPSSLGPSGIIWGATSKSVSEGWGEPDEEELDNVPE